MPEFDADHMIYDLRVGRMVPQTYRVDISLDQIMFLWLQDQIISSEGDDSWLRTASRNLGQAV